jgi:Na+-transporting NADH:ubiquinone oxidoreductase subunit NqrC
MMLTIIILTITIILCIVVVSISYVLQALYETQIKLLKDHYMLRGEMAMLTMLMDYSSQAQAQTYSFVVPEEEETPTTTFEVNMEVGEELPAT